MKRNDVLVIIVTIAIVLGAWVGLQFQEKVVLEESKVVRVYIDGEEVDSIPLSKEGVYEYKHEFGLNIFEIKDGKVNMIKASCLDLICVNQEAIDKQHESIVCLPGRFHLIIEEEGEAKIDAISK